MKKYLALFLVIVILFSLPACGKKKADDSGAGTSTGSGGQTSSQGPTGSGSASGGKAEIETSADGSSTTVVLAAVDKGRAAIEYAGALAAKQYILARLKTEALTEYDLESGSIKELQKLTQDALDAWQLAEKTSEQVGDLVIYHDNLAISNGYLIPSSDMIRPDVRIAAGDFTGYKLGDIFVKRAYAAEKKSNLEWARELTAIYDSYPAGKQVRGLAKELGVDARRAFDQLKIAQDIIIGGIYDSEAEIMHDYERAAKATNAVCKTTLYVAGFAAGGAPTTVLEWGGVIISGVDTILTVTEAGAHIVLGENSELALTTQEIQEKLEPVMAVAGIVGFVTGDGIAKGLQKGAKLADELNSLDKITYIIENIADWVDGESIMAAELGLDVGGDTTVKISEISIKDKEPEQVAEELREKGLPVPEPPSEPKTFTELAAEREKASYYTEEELNEFIDYLREVLYEAFVDDGQDEPNESQNPGPTGADEEKTTGKDSPPAATDNFPSPAEIAGFYLGRSWDPDDPDDDDDDDYSSEVTLALRPDGGLRIVDEDDDSLNLDYNSQTDTYSLVSNLGGVSIRMEMKFSYQGSGIHLSGSMRSDYGEMRLELDKQ